MFRNKLAAVTAAASIATLGAGAPMIAMSPLAFAQTPDLMQPFANSASHRAVVDGEMDWAIKESFRDYIQGNIAKGNIQFNGQPFTGSEPFKFNAEKSSMSSDTDGLISFDGEVHFYGHGGILDLKLSNFRLLIKGTQAQILVDGEGTKFVDTTTKGPHTVWKDTPLANIELSNTLDFSASTVRISGPTSLSYDKKALDMFGGFYEANVELAPVDIVLKVDDEAGAAPELGLDIEGWNGSGSGGNSGGGSGSTGSAPRKGTPAALIGDINSTLSEIDKLMVTTNSLLNNADKLFNRQPSVATGTKTAGAPAPSNNATSNNTGNTAGNNKGNTAGNNNAGGGLPRSNNSGPVGGTGVSPTARANEGAANAQASGGSGSGEVCADDGARGVQQASAAWGVRQSFRNYIKGSIAKGGWELSGVTDANNAFQWTGTSGAVNVNDKSGSILFPGAIRFTGHNGILDTRFSNMEIQFSGNSGQLILNSKSNDVDGNPHDFGRVTIADLNFTQLDISEGAIQGQATTSLTGAGAEAFGQFYEAGTALDPISFTAQLGGAPNCVDGQGAANSGASTGQGGSASQAAALRSSGSGSTSTAASGSAKSGGTSASGSGASASGVSVFDEQDGVDSESKSKSLGENQFQIKSAGEDGVTWDDSSVAQILVILASFVTSGGVLTRFVLKN